MELLGPIANVSAVSALIAMLVITFRAVSTGAWIPRAFLERIVAQFEARIAELVASYEARLKEKDAEIAEWRDVSATDRHAREVAMEQSGQLLAVSGTLNRTLDALREAGRDR